MGKVKVIPTMVKGRWGYDITIEGDDATVQDYIDGLDDFIEQEKCFRSRNQGAQTCFACNLCCQERIPVTIVDALKLGGGDLAKSLTKLLHVYVEEMVVDITMGLDDRGRCRFLDPEKGICSYYSNRPLVCHTFICCPSTTEAKQLREEIVNAGEDELVRSWFGIKGSDGLPPIHEAFQPQADIRDYAQTPFFGRTNYNQVKLKEICSPKLWQKLIR